MDKDKSKQEYLLKYNVLYDWPSEFIQINSNFQIKHILRKIQILKSWSIISIL